MRNNLKVVKCFLTAVFAVCILTSFSSSVFAESIKNYPEKTVRWIIPYSPGGGSDIWTRTAIRYFREEGILDANFLAENMPGGAEAVALTHLVTKEEGNDHVLYSFASGIINPEIRGSITYNHNDVTLIAQMMTDYYILVTPSDSPYHTLEQVIETGKKRPISIGGSAIGAPAHFIANKLAREAGIEIRFIPYGSGGEILMALLGGEIDFGVGNPVESHERIESGEFRAIVTSARERLPLLPDVPTFKELGYDITYQLFRGVAMPPGVSEEIRDFWISKFKQLSENERWRKEYIEANMLTSEFIGGEEYNQYIDEVLYPQWTEALKEIGLAK